jgi:diguanylate cyclase (GGDEF)-like protein
MLHFFFENKILWSFGLIAANLLLLLLSGWKIRGRLREIGKADRALLSRQEQILQLARENAAQRFQVQWLQTLTRSRSDLNVFFEFLRSAAGGPEAWQALLLNDNGQPIADSGMDCRNSIHLTAQGWHRLCNGSPARLSRMRQEFYCSGATVGPEEFWACACGANAIASRVLLLTHLPKVTGEQELDMDLISRLCREIEDHPFLPAGSGDSSASEDASLVRDMLELRMLTDEDFASPEELLRQFLHKLAFMTNFERASIYRQAADAHSVEILASSAMILPADLRDRWQHSETVWSAAQLDSEVHLAWCPAPSDAEEHPLLQSALLVRMNHPQFPNAVLILTSRLRMPRSEYDVELAKWSAQFLPEMFHRASTWAQLEDRARRDALTGLANRHVFETSLHRLDQRAGDAGSSNSLLLLDLDHFKSINDQHGHLVGDEVLRCVAATLQRCVHQSRVTDQPTVARFGGEEFAILLPGVPLAGAKRIAEQILHQLRTQPIPIPGGELRVTASIGIAGSPDHGRLAKDWLRAADEALYVGKRSGRNRVETAELSSGLQAESFSSAST